LQIDTDLLLITTSTADELSGGSNIDDLKRPWNPKLEVLVIFCDFRLRLRRTFKEWIFAEITGDGPRQPAYEIKPLLSRVSWALAQISCFVCERKEWMNCRWSMTPAEVNAFYSPAFNQIGVPAGILQRPVYDPGFPMYAIVSYRDCVHRLTASRAGFPPNATHATYASQPTWET